MNRFYTEYSPYLERELKKTGYDVSRIENLKQLNYETNFIYLPCFSGRSWLQNTVGCVHHNSDGYLLDNDFVKTNGHDFLDKISSDSAKKMDPESKIWVCAIMFAILAVFVISFLAI